MLCKASSDVAHPPLNVPGLCSSLPRINPRVKEKALYSVHGTLSTGINDGAALREVGATGGRVADSVRLLEVALLEDLLYDVYVLLRAELVFELLF